MTFDVRAPAVLAWIEAQIGSGSSVVRITEMPPSATEKHAIDVIDRDGSRIRAVLRRYHHADRLVEDFAYDPANEAAALRLLEATTVPAPRLISADLQGEVFDLPTLLESFVGGEQAWEPSDLEGYLRAAAEVLVAIHAVQLPAPAPVMSYRPYREDPQTLRAPRGSRDPQLWERVRHVITGPGPDERQGFIHRDYHPGNALWDGARVSGVVDWSTAATGPPGIDLARMRQNLASSHGADVADRFAERYVGAGGDASARHPFWDLLDAAELDEDDELEAPGEGDGELFEDYVASVVAELG